MAIRANFPKLLKFPSGPLRPRKTEKNNMKQRFNWMQLVRIIVMVIAVAAVIFALEYLPESPLMWVSVGLLILGFAIMLFAFRTVQRRRRAERNQTKK